MKRCLILALSFAATLASAQLVVMPDSTNNRLVGFDPMTGALVNSNIFSLAGGTPIHAMQVGSEIWVSEQVGDRVSRWSMTGTALGAITGSLDNVRGMGRVGNTIYVTSTGTGNGAPGRQVRMYDPTGASLGNFLAPASSGFHVFAHRGNILVSSDAANDDVHEYSLSGTSVGTFHNSTGLNFAEQMDYAANGDILVAGFSTNAIVRLNPTTGSVLGTMTASGVRGVFQLGNGNVLWSNGSGVHVFNVSTGGSTQVYAGGGRFLEQLTPVPEPGTALVLAGGLALLARRRSRGRSVSGS